VGQARGGLLIDTSHIFHSGLSSRRSALRVHAGRVMTTAPTVSKRPATSGGSKITSAPMPWKSMTL
jgi:hypothetical protein